jgi:hypothetical protein
MKDIALGAGGKLTNRKRTNVTKNKRHVGVELDIEGFIFGRFGKGLMRCP